MKEVKKYYYNITNCFVVLAVIFLILIAIIYRIVFFLQLNKMDDVKVLLIFGIFPLLFLCYFLFSYFIPAMKGEAAIELNESGLFSRVRRINLKWNEMSGVRFNDGKKSYRGGTSSIAIDLKDATAYKSKFNNPLKKLWMLISEIMNLTPIVIPLFLVEGEDEETYRTIEIYLYQHFNN